MKNYKVGDIIEWCDETYEILEIYGNGNSGKVKYGNGEIVNNFNFNFQGEEAIIKSRKEDNIETHLTHCYQGEYETTCKYLDDNCPAKPKQETKEIDKERGCGVLLLKHFGCNINCGDFFLGETRLCLACSIKNGNFTKSEGEE